MEMNAVSGRPELLVVDRGDVPGDQSARLQALDALVHRRRGEAGRLPRSVNDIRPSRASSSMIRRSVPSNRGRSRGQGSGAWQDALVTDNPGA